MGPACLLVCTDNQGHRPNSLASSDLSLPCGKNVPFWGQRLSAVLFFPTLQEESEKQLHLAEAQTKETLLTLLPGLSISAHQVGRRTAPGAPQSSGNSLAPHACFLLELC